MCKSSCLKSHRKRLLGHHSQVKREAVGFWWGEEGPQNRGSLQCLLKICFGFNKNRVFLEGAS